MRHGKQRLTRAVLPASCRPKSHPTAIYRPWQPIHKRRQSSTTDAPSSVPASSLSPRQDSTSTTPSGQAPTQPPRRKYSTPLAETIANAIEVTGPISIAAYMRQCLTNPHGGYYTTTRPQSDQFGTKGDFITSPEISQMFGELVGIWFLTEWIGQGRPKEGVQFVEVGPGRGTMMSDILRTVAQFRSFAGAVEGIWLVEAGEGLRRQQCDLLCGEQTEMKEMTDEVGKIGWEAPSKHKKGNGESIPIRWVEDMALLPKNQGADVKMPFIVAHEFFDALPIYSFESVAAAPDSGTEGQKAELLSSDGRPLVTPSAASKVPQWRELLVQPTRQTTSLSLKPSPLRLSSGETKEPDPDFSLTVAKASNPNSLVIPAQPRFEKLKSQPESRIEVSPESSRYIQDFAKRIGGDLAGAGPPPTPAPASSSRAKKNESSNRRAAAGAALIIDYGPLETTPVNSLRGIREHRVISPFVYAGQADISADVDFGALADAALEASEGVEVHGPVEQGTWLTQLGIHERATRLVQSVGSDEQKKKDLETGWKRLVEGGPRGMGKAYKIMAVVPENRGQRRPVGFGGGVI